MSIETVLMVFIILGVVIWLQFSEAIINFLTGGSKNKESNKPRRAKENVYGSASLMTKNEMFKKYPSYTEEADGTFINANKWDEDTLENPGGIVIHSELNEKKQTVEAIYNNKRIHHGIIGSTGSGKTTGFIANSITSIGNSGASMIIGDPKGELYTQYGKWLKDAKGYTVQVLNFDNPACGQNFNQLDFICKQYEQGMPYAYRSKALREMIKFIQYLSADIDEDRPNLNGYQEKESLTDRKRETLFTLSEYIKITPNTKGKLDTKNGDILIKYLRELFTKSYKAVDSNFNKTPGYTNSGNIKTTEGNVYLHYKQEQTIQQGIEILKDTTLDEIKNYFNSRLEYYEAFLESIDVTSTLYVITQDKIVMLKDIINDITNEENLSSSILIRYFTEYELECAQIFEEFESEAVKNATTIAGMIIESQQVGNSRGESIWIETPKALLTSLILFIARESHLPYSKHLGSAYRMMSDLSEPVDKSPGSRDATTILDKILESFLPQDAIRLSQTATRVAGDKTKSSINVSLITPIQVFADQLVVSQCARTSFNADEIVDRPTAIFLNIPGKDSNQAYTILASLFIEQMYTILLNRAKQYSNLSLPRPVYYLIDEFGNIPKIPNFDSKISLGRSYNIRFNYVIQSLAQLEQTYKSEKETILGNSTLVYLLTNDYNTAKFVSDRLGKYTAEIDNESTQKNDNGSSVSHSKQLMGRELFTPQELMDESFTMGTSIYIEPRANPFIASTVPNYKMPNTKNINEMRIYDLRTKRPVEEVNFFAPKDYDNFITAYRSFWEDCILDEFFYKAIRTVKTSKPKTEKAVSSSISQEEEKEIM